MRVVPRQTVGGEGVIWVQNEASWSDTSITAAVPAGATTGDVVVTVGGEASDGVEFTVTPAIGSLSPDSGPEGTSVDVSGTSFGATQGTSTVTFNGISATATSWSDTSITAAVPAGATTGDVVVTVGGEASDGVEFTVTPAIGSLSPDSGPAGTSVEITGTSFGATQGTSTIAFNGTAATATNWSDTSITAAVPSGATTGDVVVTVGGEASDGVEFTVTPAIGSLSPDSGPEGTSVDISGTSFGASQGTSTVNFNGTSATATSWSGTSITAAVPAGATSGNVVVTVESQASNGVAFTVKPAITGLSPDTGPEGLTVEITGTSFGAAQGTSTVTFNGLVATPSSWDDTSITVTVPAGATTGEVVVSVGGQASNGVTFTVRENRAPETEGEIPGQTVNKGESADLTVSSYFSDPDEDELEYTAVSSDTAKVTVAVDGAVVTLTGVAKGETTVTVAASDGDLSAEQAFTVTVPNRVPATVGSVSAQTVNKGSNLELTVSSYFSDADEDELEYTVVSSDTAKVTAAVNGAVVTLTGVARGEATVTVTASDGSQAAQQAFTATVPNGAPVCGNVPAQTLWVDDDLAVNLSAYCSDPDDDPLTYTAGSSDTSKVTESVSGSTLTLAGKALGSSTITVTAQDNPGDPRDSLSATGTFTATVKNRDPDCTFSSQTLDPGRSKDLAVTAQCTEADGHSMTYTAASSSDSNIVSVERRDNNTVVRITGESAGTATVTVTVADGHGGAASKSFSVTVKPSCDLSSIGNQTIYKGDSRRLSLSSACDGTYSASSSDTGKVTESVDNARDELTIAGAAEGTATVTVTARKSGYADDSVSFTVRVRIKPSCDLSSIGNQTIYKGDSRRLSLSSACNGTYSASSSDTGKVTESVSGSTLKITGVEVGTARVTVRVTKSGYRSDSATFTVTVTPPPPDPDATLTATSTTLDADGCTFLKWTTEDANSASIDMDVGTVTPTGTGSKKVCPGEEKTYTLTAHGDPNAINPTVKRSVTVKPSCDLSSIGNQTIFKGDSKTISLSSACSGTYSADSSDTGKVTESVSGSDLTITAVSVGTATVTVRVEKTGYWPDSVTFTVTVKKQPKSPTATLTADSTTITEGNCTDLDWTTTNAESGSIDGVEIASTDLASGSKEVCPDATKTYTLSVTGQTGADPLTASDSVTVTVDEPVQSTPSITSISPSLQRPDDPVTIYGNHFGTAAGSVSFGGHSISSFGSQGYSWSNTSISLLIPGSLGAGQVSVSVTTSGGSTSNSYSYTVTGGPVGQGQCEEGDEDCPEGTEDSESGDSDEGGTDEDAAEGGG